jgi:hypothetical protein
MCCMLFAFGVIVCPNGFERASYIEWASVQREKDMCLPHIRYGEFLGIYLVMENFISSV